MKKLTCLSLVLALILLLCFASAWAQGTWQPKGFGYAPYRTAEGTDNNAATALSQARIDTRLGKDMYVGDPILGNTLQTSVAYLTANSITCKLHITAPQSLSANLSIPSYVTLAPDPGAVITIPSGVTLTINGPFQAGLYQVFSYTGTGQGPQANNTGSWPLIFSKTSVKELYPQWWGAVGDDTHADWLPCQQMCDCSIASGDLPMFCPGTFKLSDTLKVGYGTSAVKTGLFAGAGGSRASGPGTIFDATAFNDRPAISICAARDMQFKGFQVLGGNAAPATAVSGGSGGAPDPVLADWITAGCSNGQYSPYCGIAIDPYTGSKPAGGYSNDAYGRGSSSGVFFEDVCAQGFVVGLMASPSSNQDGSFISFRDGELAYNTYGYSGGSTQSDSPNFYNTWIEGAWCSVTTNTHGQQGGKSPNWYGGGVTGAWKIFDLNCNGPCLVSGIWAEGFGWLGNFDVLSGSIACAPVKVESCHFTLNFPYEPYFFTATPVISFDTCEFEGSSPVFNYMTGFGVTYKDCSWLYSTPPFIGLIDYQILINGYQFINNVSNGTYLNGEFKGSYSGRTYISPWTTTARFYANNGYANYHVVLPYYGYWAYEIQISGAAITGTGHSAVLTFTAGSAADWKNGDLIFWQVPERSGTYTTFKIPAFQVVNISGTTITANSLVDNVNVSYLPTQVNIAIPLFLWSSSYASTGDTHSNTTLDNVTNIGNWAIGDWIQGTGIPNNTRITNIVSTTITLSNAATATANGVSIYNSGLVPENVTEPRVYQAPDGASISLSSDDYDTFYQSNTQGSGTLTVNNFSGTPTAFQSVQGIISSTNSQTFAWGNAFVGSTDFSLPATIGAGKEIGFVFKYDPVQTKWVLVALTNIQ